MRALGTLTARAALAAALLLAGTPARACAVCYGESDSPMAAGMNWGIFTLLVVIVSVLGGVACCAITLARRAAAADARTLAAAPADHPARA